MLEPERPPRNHPGIAKVTLRLQAHLQAMAVVSMDEELAVMVYQRLARGADRHTAIWLVAAIAEVDSGTVERAIDGEATYPRAS